MLKNALLSFALISIGKVDKDFNYGSYDGSYLPPASGYDTSNACFTYMATNPFMLDKRKAIDMYIDMNLNSNESINQFFNEFLEKHVTKSQDTPEDTDEWAKM